jgi:hypothetical protein
MGTASEIIGSIHLAKTFRNLPCSSGLRVIDAGCERGDMWDRWRKGGLMGLKSSYALLSSNIKTSKHVAEPGRKEISR